jgi:hypothetical protein
MLAIATIGAALLGPALAADETLPAQSPAQAVSGQPVGPESSEDLSKLLPVLLTSAERKQLAAELEASIRQGDLKAAEDRLNAAIEMGTLAIVLVDRLQDPKLLAALQAFGIRGDNLAASAPKAGADAAKVAELEAALTREQTQNSAVSRELAALMQEYRNLAERSQGDAASAGSKISELQGALQQERDKSETASRQVASLQDELRTLQATQAQSATSESARVTEMQQTLQRERERSESTSRQLASLQDEHRTLQDVQTRNIASTKSKVLELQNAWQQERARGDEARSQLAKAEADLRAAQTAQAQSAGAESTRIAEIQKALQQEREQREEAKRQSAKAEAELRTLRAAQAQSASSESTRMAEMQDALARAQARGDALAQELAGVSKERDSLRKAQEASVTPPQTPQSASALQVSPLLQVSQTAAMPAAADPLKRTVASAVAPSDLDLGGIVAPAGQTKAAPQPSDPAAKPASAQDSPRTDDRLLVRADELFRRGDVSGARLLLERSMEAGHPRAAFLLAETFDPHVLSRLGALGIRGDAGKARELYARARSLGVAQAQERIEALK